MADYNPLDTIRNAQPDLTRMGTDIPAPKQGQLLLEALARAVPLGANQREQGEAKAREAATKAKARPGGKDLDVGMLLQRLMESPSTETSQGIGDAYRFSQRPTGHDELQPEIQYKRP